MAEYVCEISGKSGHVVLGESERVVRCRDCRHGDAFRDSSSYAQSCRSDIDRDALLALADEMEEKSEDWDVAQGGIPLVHAGYLPAYARRIREALGVEA